MVQINVRPALDTTAAVEDYTSSLRSAGHHIAPVIWRGEAAWLKLAVPQPPAWRYKLLGAMAKTLAHPAMQPVRPQGGTLGLKTEADRVRALTQAGLRAPAILETGEAWLLLSDLGQATLDTLIRRASANERMRWWRQGADYILNAHRAGQYLSQAFARNFVWSDTAGVGAIDFEDDAGTVMSLTHAQVRDWLPYCFSTAIHFTDDLPGLQATMAEYAAAESDAVRAGLRIAWRRTSWLRAARFLPARMQRTDVRKIRLYGELAKGLGAMVTMPH